MLEEADMEKRQLEFDVPKVPRAFSNFLITCPACGNFIGDTQSLVEDAIRCGPTSWHLVKLLRPYEKLANLLHLSRRHQSKLNF